MSLTLHDYQKKGVRLSLECQTLFEFMGVGLGKTAITATAIERIGWQAVVFAPPLVAATTWPEEVAKWTKLSCTVLEGEAKEYRCLLDRDVYVLSFGMVKWFLENFKKIPFKKKPILVLDESSMIKSHNTARFQMLRALSPLFSRYRMALSATPTPNGLHELWPQAYMLDQGKRLGKNVTTFYDRYFEPRHPPYYKVYPRHDTHDKIFDSIADITYRLDGKDYNKMPEEIYNSIPIKMPKKVRALYTKLEKEFCVNVNDALINATTPGSLSMKLRQVVQGAIYETLTKREKLEGKTPRSEYLHIAKINMLKEMLETAAGNPILCAIQFKFELDMIHRYIRRDIPVIAGATSVPMAKAYIRDWNKGDLPLLLCHPLSIGHGLNLQAGGHTIIWYGLTWSLEQYIQLNGRLARQGQRKGVVINHFVMQDSIDERVFQALTMKDATQSRFLDALRDYAYERA